MIVTQHALGEDTEQLRERAPKTWAYLVAHRRQLDARKSSIYRGQPPFAMFGVGAYSFAPHKIAICGLYKRLAFRVIDPVDGRSVMLDDISYFLPCSDHEQAVQLARALNGERAQEFFRARLFWDAKRPINKGLLQSMSLDALLRAEGTVPRSAWMAAPRGTARARQLGLAGIT